MAKSLQVSSALRTSQRNGKFRSRSAVSPSIKCSDLFFDTCAYVGIAPIFAFLAAVDRESGGNYEFSPRIDRFRFSWP
jgi:hypothetical protein